MSEELLIKHCSPTLAGIKTGSLFSCRFAEEKELKNCVKCWNTLLKKKGLRILPVRLKNTSALIYVYRPVKLCEDLKKESAKKILCDRGYCVESCERCVATLIKKVCEEKIFPHEIGLFLGYPPEDVLGFIENKASGCKTAGCWKVYGDEDAAKKIFKKYKKCTDIYCDKYKKGRSIERLTVAV